MTVENAAPRPVSDKAWQCNWCFKWFPVAILARDCERKH